MNGYLYYLYITGEPVTGESIHLLPCEPDYCGPNSECSEDEHGRPVCSCLKSHECSDHQSCIRKKCQDPCPGLCGKYAQCTIKNHNPYCTCNPGFTGDPFTSCWPIIEDVIEDQDPCNPNPCGPNSQHQEISNQCACSCLTPFIGVPPNCRPE